MTDVRDRGRLALAEAKGCDSLLVTDPANVRYLTGFSGSSGCALITPRQRLFFTDSRYQLRAEKEVKGFSVRIVSRALLDGACVYVNSKKIALGNLGFEGRHLSYAQHLGLRRSLKKIKLIDAGDAVKNLRAIKTRREIGSIRKAASIADAAFKKLKSMKVVGRSEREVAAILEYTMKQNGSERMPFEIIVASGRRTAMPHAATSGRIIRKDELLLIDMGASVDGYCCDVTRTFATGRLPARLQSLYRIVMEAQGRAIGALKPGLALKDADSLARDHITSAGYGRNFRHSLGHGVGLETHEAPVLSPLSEGTLEQGMTVTVEPGIYVSGSGGVRIEDTILIDSRGPVMLTRFTRELINLR